jgi:WD40 repeat protein
VSAPKHLLFLSHAGTDSAAAVALAERIEAAPEAQKHDLKVWVDKRGLEAGKLWQEQLEDRIERESTAFAVYLGASGAQRWVEAEVRLALSRARSDPRYPFIPIVSTHAEGTDGLPGFAGQYQAVFEVETNPNEFAKLVRAALRHEPGAPLRLEKNPFLGLNEFGKNKAHLFFGREQETYELVRRLRRTPLVMVVGDSGSGKSSLVKAGLAPAYRRGALAESAAEDAGGNRWHVMQTRPHGWPFEALADSATDLARTLNVDPGTREILGRMIRGKRDAEGKRLVNVEEVRSGLREAIPVDGKLLLVVDQFEELLTQAPEEEGVLYVTALLNIARAGDSTMRVVLTMRGDYYNLCADYAPLYDRLQDPATGAQYRLRRMSDEGLRRCIEEPLKLGGVTDATAFADEVMRDLGERPGDLALLQMALTETWLKRKQFEGDLLKTYRAIGRLAGALANAAEEVYLQHLDEAERALAQPVFIRMVRLGDTGGTTRRIATKMEFEPRRWRLVQKLASVRGKRLLLVGGENDADTVEIAHEALVTQWPRYQRWLQNATLDKRLLEPVIQNARRWVVGNRHPEHLATGRSLADALTLLQRRATWLSADERAFVVASNRADRLNARLRHAGIGLISALTLLLVLFLPDLIEEKIEDMTESFDNRASQIIGEVSESERDPPAILQSAIQLTTEARAYHKFIYLAGIIGIREDSFLGNPQYALQQTLQRITRDNPRTVDQPLQWKSSRDPVWSLNFSPDGHLLATAGWSKLFHLWDLASVNDSQPAPVLESVRHHHILTDVRFNPNGQLLAAGELNSNLSIWRVTGEPRHAWNTDQDAILSVHFSPDGKHLATAGWDGTIRIWTLSGKRINDLNGHKGPVRSISFSPKGTLLASAGEDGRVCLWQFVSTENMKCDGWQGSRRWIWAVTFDPKGELLVTTGEDGMVRVWNLSKEPVTVWDSQQGRVTSVDFSPDGQQIVTLGWDGTVRLWTRSGKRLAKWNIRSPGTSLSINPDTRHGRQIAAANLEGDVIILTLPDLDKLVEQGCDWLRDNHPSSNVACSTSH